MLLLPCGRGRIVLWGDLAAVLCRGLKDARPPFRGWLPGDLVSPGSVVAGTRNPILAIGRTGDSPDRRIARPAMARDAGSKPSTSYIPPNLRYSAIFCDAAADGFGIKSHWSAKLRRHSARTG